VSVQVPLGSYNQFIKDGTNSTAAQPGQPINFLPGVNPGVKVSEPKTASMQWNLDGNMVLGSLSTFSNSNYCPSAVSAVLTFGIPCPANTGTLQNTFTANFLNLVNNVRKSMQASPNEVHNITAQVQITTPCSGNSGRAYGTVSLQIQDPAGAAPETLQAPSMDLLFPILTTGNVAGVLANTTATVHPDQYGRIVLLSSAGINRIVGSPNPNLVPVNPSPDVTIGSIEWAYLTFFVVIGGAVLACVLLCVTVITCCCGVHKRNQKRNPERV